ncbi:uncharacterized protein LOC132256344 [Phlebotomus argentipes]|uniref:uncharacterized protein LOC132256344 n=1 Tax=Phlebotomus argentipes TaxID=94469 RepID=UPI002892A520|nr:uncharacterized protein LOC132256344 [Phlebotomus argentipes]
MFADEEYSEESDTNALLMGVLRELKDIKETLANHTKQLQDLQDAMDLMANNFQCEEMNFPITTFEDLEAVEDMMKNTANRQYVTMQMRTLLNAGDDKWLSKLMNDDLLEEFSTDGLYGKRNLLELEIIKFATKLMGLESRIVAYHLRKMKDKLQKSKRYGERRKLGNADEDDSL